MQQNTYIYRAQITKDITDLPKSFSLNNTSELYVCWFSKPQP